MSIGRNRIRQKAPRPTGLLLEQGYRWAKLFHKWLTGFESSTGMSTVGATAFNSTYNLLLSVTAPTSVGNSTSLTFKVFNSFGNSVAGAKQFRFWMADATYGLQQNKNPVIVMSAGTLLEKDGTMRWANMLTDATGRCKARLTYPPGNSAYVNAMLAHGKPYALGFKMKWSATSGQEAFYLWFSVKSESANFIPVHVEARRSADNTRYQHDLTIYLWFAGIQWGLAGNLAGVTVSGGCQTITTVDLNPDVLWVRIRSTGANIIKLNETGAQDWFVHGGVLHGFAYVASTKADFS